MMSIQAIRVIRGCGASGNSLAAGATYAVPGEVSHKDAELLVRLGKAEAVALPEARAGAAAVDVPKVVKMPRRKAGA